MISLIRIPIVSCRQGYYVRWYYNGWHYWNFFSGLISYLTEGEKYRTTGSRIVDLNSGPVDESGVEALRTLLNATELYIYTDGGWAEAMIESSSVIVQKARFSGYEMQFRATLGSRKISPVNYSVGVEKEILIPPEPDPVLSPDADAIYVGRFNQYGTGSGIRLFGSPDRSIEVFKISTGKYSIYQYLSTTDYITLGVADDGAYSTISLRAMSSIGVNSHIVYTSDDSSLNNANTRFLINYGDMANTKICVGNFNSAGTTITQLYGEPLTLGISRLSTGKYEITHNIGHTDYIVLGVGTDTQTVSIRAMDDIASTSVTVYTSDDASLNDGAQRFIIIWE